MATDESRRLVISKRFFSVTFSTSVSCEAGRTGANKFINIAFRTGAAIKTGVAKALVNI